MPHTRVNIALLGLDDNPDSILVVEECIKEIGVSNYKLFTDNNEFLDNINSVHVIILDHMLPPVSGLDVLKTIRKKSPQSFVIVYTGYNDSDVKTEYINMGIEKWVDKNRKDYLEQLKEFVKEGLLKASDRLELMNYYLSKRIELENKTL